VIKPAIGSLTFPFKASSPAARTEIRLQTDRFDANFAAGMAKTRRGTASTVQADDSLQGGEPMVEVVAPELQRKKSARLRAFVVSAVLFNVVGCGARKDDDFAPNVSRRTLRFNSARWPSFSTTLQAAPPAPGDSQRPADFPPILADWPTPRPDVVLVFTGEMLGYMKPCGCSPGQHGGLARRAGFLKFLREEKKWPTLPVELGDLIAPTKLLENDRYKYSLRALHRMGYPALGVGPEDLKLGVTHVLAWTRNLTQIRFLAANLRHNDEDLSALMAENLARAVVEEIEGTKVGLACVIGDAFQGKLGDPDLGVTDAVGAARDAADQLETAGAHLKVLLTHMSFDEALKLAKDCSDYDLVVCRSTFDDSGNEVARIVDETMITWVGRKGKSAGVVGFWKTGNPRLRFEVVPIDVRFKEDPTVDAVYADYVDAIKRAGFIDRWSRKSVPDEDEFVGDEACRNCHNQKKTPIYDHWKQTGHAHALETLEKKSVPPGQDFNPECVGCHVVGFGFETGYRSVKETAYLAGVQCESCHGPGGKHAAEENEKDKDEPKLFRPPKFPDAKSIETLCLSCHDAENDLDFDFFRDYAKVIHPGSKMPAKK
jgi:hypothetical protein